MIGVTAQIADPLVGVLLRNPVSAATLLYLVVRTEGTLRGRIAAVAAASTAVARETDGVDGDRAAAETDADRRDVEALRTDGGEP